jgi:glycosyltransferase involved in cell wall biosynthesis
MRILFITRNFPPQKGGLERVAFYLYSYLKENADVILLRWAGSKKLLFFVLPYFLMRAFWILAKTKIDIIYLNEGFLSILGVFLKPFRVPILITVHGLDVTYKNKLYQLIVPGCISKLDKIICISRATKEECIKRKIAKSKVCIIPDGFRDEFYLDEDKEKLKKKVIDDFELKIIDNKKILFSVCRLIERKGIHWFVEKVIPLLIDEFGDFIYIVAGDGPMRRYVEDIIHKKNLHNWVMLLGKIKDDSLKIFYNISDIFVMPNIPIKGDMEGFGVVALEASSCKLPVVASNLEGIRDVLLDGDMGILIPPLDEESFKKEIIKLLNNDHLRREYGRRARKLAIENFDWSKIVKRYLEVFGKTRCSFK